MGIKEIYEENMNKSVNDGSDYNIFQVLGVKHDEVKICRIIADLLNPYGLHGQKEKFLNLFLTRFLKKENFSCTSKDCVYTQEQTTEGRFIDISIDATDFYIPIEVKIRASDLDKQCDDYIAHAKTTGKRFEKLLYITLDKRMPAENSCSKENQKYVSPISFAEICDWLKDCLYYIDKYCHLYDVIHQLTQILTEKPSKYDMRVNLIIKEICSFLKDDNNNELHSEERMILQEINKEKFRFLCYEAGYDYENSHGKGLPYLYKFLFPNKQDNYDYFWLNYNGKCGFYPRNLEKGKNLFGITEEKDEKAIMQILCDLNPNSLRNKIEEYIKEVSF